VARGWSEFWERLSEVAVRTLDDFVQATRANGAQAFLYLPFLDEGLPADLVPASWDSLPLSESVFAGEPPVSRGGSVRKGATLGRPLLRL